MTPRELSLDRFKHIVFFTGAGLSAECGLPTYRGKGGIWGSYDWRDYACQRAFDRDPAAVWRFHDERRGLMADVEPSLSHRIIAAVQAAHAQVHIVTQNIDGLHQRGGGVGVIELHGSVWRVRCGCAGPAKEHREQPIDAYACPTCGEWRRPDIVWFEDPMQRGPLEAAADAMQDCDLLVSIGTSGVVYPAAQMPEMAQARGALCVEINPEDTPVSGCYSVQLRMRAAEGLTELFPQIVAEVEGAA